MGRHQLLPAIAEKFLPGKDGTQPRKQPEKQTDKELEKQATQRQARLGIRRLTVLAVRCRRA
jgi:hypothetical protein